MTDEFLTDPYHFGEIIGDSISKGETTNDG